MHNAENLKAMDSHNNKSDPYVVVKYGSADRTVQTRILKETLDPSWNETLKIYSTLSELKKDGLLMTILDQDVVSQEAGLEKNDLLGEQPSSASWTPAGPQLTPP